MQCLSVSVFFPFILDIKFVGRTSRGHTVGRSHTGFLIHLLSAVHALIFLARRIQPFLSLVDREVEFCVLKADSYAYEKLIRKWTKSVFFGFFQSYGYENGPDSYGQIRLSFS